MGAFINSPLTIGSLEIPNRLIQGPLAGYSCAPFRESFIPFASPGFCVTEMSSAKDVLHKHSKQSRYLHRSPLETILSYQISGHEVESMASAAAYLQSLGADLIDINCGCPKAKIRKKGAGSALLDDPKHLIQLIQALRGMITIPLTVKIRIQGNDQDYELAKQIEAAGADALIVHGRRWVDDYDKSCDWQQIAGIKKSLQIPVIANGDIHDFTSLNQAIEATGCDGYMISRAGTGKPWLYKELLEGKTISLSFLDKIELFMQHVSALSKLENEFKAILQSRSLLRYYFRAEFRTEKWSNFYQQKSLKDLKECFKNQGL